MLIPHYSAIPSVPVSDRMRKINRFTSDKMFVDHYLLEPGQSQHPHTHDGNDKVYIVLDGFGVFRLGDEEHCLGAGEGCVAPAGLLHGVRNDTSATLVLLVMMAPNGARPTPVDHRAG